MALFLVANGPMPTNAAQAAVATGTSIKTLLQVKPSTGTRLKIVEWGVSFDGAAAATPGKVELIETDVAATVTAFSTADFTKFNEPGGAAADTSYVVLGTSSSGYTSTNEGSVTAIRMFDVQYLPPTNPYVKQFPLGREPMIEVSKFLRIRVTFGASVNAYAYVVIDV